jgi:type II secretory ATPase GspE/PulE/Tfp pilus assembly ATPase PilB-like protein
MNEDEQAQRYRDQEERSTQQRAALLGLQYLDTRGMTRTAELYKDILSLKEMYEGKIVPLQIGSDEKSFIFAITTTTPQSTMRSMEKFYNEDGKSVSFYLISNLGYREFMERYDPPKEIIYDDVKIAKEGDSETIQSVSETLESVSSDKILDYLIDQADKLGASDIHIENQRDNVRVRLRVDGALHPVAEISHEKYRILTASIASRADISTASTDAQTGHMQKESVATTGKTVNMRIETIPTAFGIDAVIRLFNFDESLLKIDKIGLDPEREQHIKEIVSHPHGMVMVVGPTGSGKSTTLFSIINALNDPSRKIITLEDPVEITVPGISQIPIDTNKGKTFADNLRSVLRLDPDVVMVGEIRDADTAKTAIQASITGHLVLTTFHAASSAAAFSRMVDMIGQNPIFSNAIKMVLSQRLVRRLDDDTKIEYTPDEATKKWMKQALGKLPHGYEQPDIDNSKLWRPGITEDSPFGYKGRIMIYELMLVDERIQKFIRGEMADIDVNSIERVAQEQGMLTMMQDGILKALRGETTLEELNRVL